MSKDIEYILHKYLNSKGNMRLYNQLTLMLEVDLIYNTKNRI